MQTKACQVDHVAQIGELQTVGTVDPTLLGGKKSPWISGHEVRW